MNKTESSKVATHPLGIYSWFGYSFSLKKRLEMIKKAGFDATCLWFGHEEAMVKEGLADQMPALVRNMGLILDNIHAPFYDHHLLWSGSQVIIEKIQNELESALIFCAKHHIPKMVAHLATGDKMPPSSKGIQVIRDLVTSAENLGVTIAIENTENIETFNYLEYIFTNIQSPNLGFCYDSSHDFITGQSRGQGLGKWGKSLVTTHLSDNFGINDDHLLPGKGNIDWKSIERNFPKSYTEAIMLEVDGPESSKGFKPEEFLNYGYQWLRGFEQLLLTELKN